MRHRRLSGGHRYLPLIWFLGAWVGAGGCATPEPSSAAERAGQAVPASFAVYALSRGRGVPEPTRQAWQAVWTMLQEAQRQGAVVRLRQTHIGLEGEVRLCAEFADPGRMRAMLARARDIARGVELLNVVEEPCSEP
jgi:hypothetical protein